MLETIIVNLETKLPQLVSFEADPTKTVASEPKPIPFEHLIFSPNKDRRSVMEHCRNVYESIYFLNKMSREVKNKIAEKAIQKAVMLRPRPTKASTGKTLLIDLDETLICSGKEETHCFGNRVTVKNSDIWFSLRPYAIEFLENMSCLYELVLFTAAEREYAQAFFEFFNQRTNGAFNQFLCRQECVHLYKGLFVKDLRAISNRHLKDMALLDNSVHCFGGLINNGIPIKSFTADQKDLELKHLESYLRMLSEAEDVREHNRSALKLMTILEVESVPA